MLTNDDLQKIDALFAKRSKKTLVSVRRMLRKETNSIINHFDTTVTNHEHRIQRIEYHLDLPPIVD